MSEKKLPSMLGLKMMKPFIKPFLNFLVPFVTEKKQGLELFENETEVCLLFQETNGKIIASIPVFDDNDTITRYIPIEGQEAIDFTNLIETFSQTNKTAKNATTKIS
jgi:hypothetical protein